MNRLALLTGLALSASALFGQVTMVPANAHVNMYFPQLADGGPAAARWQTVFTFVSASASDARIILSLYDNEGKPMPIDFGTGPSASHTVLLTGYGSKTLVSRMASATTLAGWAIAKSDMPISASASFRLWLDGKASQEVTAAPTKPTYAYDSYANKDLGLALANPSASQPVTLNLFVSDSIGNTNATPVQVTLPPLGHTSFNLRDRFPYLDSSDWALFVAPSTFPGAPFLAWTMNAAPVGTFSSLPDGSHPRPGSHKDRIELIFARLVEMMGFVDAYRQTPVLTVTNDQGINPTIENGVNINVPIGLAEVFAESDNELAFILAHLLGHAHQAQYSDSRIWDPDKEKDAHLWAILITLFAGYDIYAAPGALGHLVAATGATAAITANWEQASRVAANTALKAQLDQSLATIKEFCAIDFQVQTVCDDYKRLYRPHVPTSAGTTSAAPGTSFPLSKPEAGRLMKRVLERQSQIR